MRTHPVDPLARSSFPGALDATLPVACGGSEAAQHTEEDVVRRWTGAIRVAVTPGDSDLEAPAAPAGAAAR